MISVCVGFYSVYHKVASGVHFTASDHNFGHDDVQDDVQDYRREDLDNFRGFLRTLIMHGAIGTALGGVTTLVGEPQNLLIAEKAGWGFFEFFLIMAPVTIPVLIAGFCTCVALEFIGWFSYGYKFPPAVREILDEYKEHENSKRKDSDKVELVVQGVVALILVAGLAFISPKSV